MFNLDKILKEFQAVNPSLKDINVKLKGLRVTAEAGAGLVSVTMNGMRKVVAVDVDTSLLEATQKNILQDLTVAAINLAFEKVDVEIKEMLRDADLLKNFM